eukprot:4733542-Prymnesium_polylepis.2
MQLLLLFWTPNMKELADGLPLPAFLSFASMVKETGRVSGLSIIFALIWPTGNVQNGHVASMMHLAGGRGVGGIGGGVGGGIMTLHVTLTSSMAMSLLISPHGSFTVITPTSEKEADSM